MIVNIEDVEFVETGNGKNFAHRRKSLARRAGGEMLGCSYYEVAPGKTTWPLHAHLANEEAMFIMEGEATLVLGKDTHTVKKGDYICLPVGQDYAHKITNTGKEPLKYLCMSTMTLPDVCIYPDSQKVGVYGSNAPLGVKDEAFSGLFSTTKPLEYFDGEDA